MARKKSSRKSTYGYKNIGYKPQKNYTHKTPISAIASRILNRTIRNFSNTWSAKGRYWYKQK